MPVFSNQDPLKRGNFQILSCPESGLETPRTAGTVLQASPPGMTAAQVVRCAAGPLGAGEVITRGPFRSPATGGRFSGLKSALAWRPGATTGRALTRSGRPGPGVSLDPLRGGASGGSGRGSPGTPARPPRSGLRLCGPTAGGSAARAARAKMAAGVQPAPGGEAGAVPQEPARLARAPSGEVAPAWPAYGDP